MPMNEWEFIASCICVFGRFYNRKRAVFVYLADSTTGNGLF